MRSSVGWMFCAGCVLAGCGDDRPAGAGDAGLADGEIPDGALVDGAVVEGNAPPSFVNEPPDAVDEGDTYLHGALAEDPDGEIVRYRKVAGPEGLVVAERTGAVYWAVPQDAEGVHELVLEASDPNGLTTQQSAMITVRRVNVAPRIRSIAPRFGTRGTPYRYDVVAIDEDGDTLAYTIPTGPPGAAFESAAFVWPSPSAGVARVTITVADPDGASDTQSFAIGVGSGIGGVPPTVRIDDPPSAATIEVAVPVRGAAGDSDLAGWLLEGCQPDVTGHCSELARGDAMVAGPLGTLDPAPFLDQPLVLRLTAWDAERNEASTTRNVAIMSRNHPGLFGVEMVDLVTRVDGQRVELIRSYDSRRLHTSDFGAGWELSSNIEAGMAAMPMLTTTGPMSTGWMVVVAFPSVFLDPLTPHDVELELPDGRVYVFQFAPEPDGFTAEFAVANWLAPPGTSITPITEAGGTYGDGGLVIFNRGSDAELTNYDLTPYEPPAYRIATERGETFEITSEGRVISTTGYTPGGGGTGAPVLMRDGVYGSRGRVVEFDRDAMGRITRIRDTRYSREVTYSYVDEGLSAVVHPPDGLRSTYAYEEGRLATYELPPPLGLTRVEFDERGRVIRRVLPEGGIMVYDYDDEARTVRVRDAAGGDTLTEYDANGDVIAMTNALGERETFEYDANGHQTLRRDAEGREWRYRYDAAGNLLETAEPGMVPTRATYDGNVPTEVTGERGRMQLTASPDGRMARVVGPTGGEVFRIESDEDGRPTRMGRGSDVSTFTYDGEGRIDRYTADGHEYDVAFSADDLRMDVMDENGDAIYAEQGPDGETLEIGSSEGVVEYDYDFDGNLSRVTIGDETIEYEYDASGQLLGASAGDDVVAERQYDAAGRLVLDRDADGAYTHYRYDVAGRVISEASPAGTTSLSYDRGGQVVEQQTAEGVHVAYERDAAGRVTRVSDTTGYDVGVGYDASGRVGSIDAGEGRTELDYDATTGLLSSVTTPMGAEQYTYDMRFAESDASETPPLASLREPTGVLWTYGRDDSARLTSVTHPDGTTRTSYRYEADSDRIASVVDALSNEWSFTWDGDELVEMRTPEGLRTTYSREADGDSTITRADGTTERVRFEGDQAIREFGGMTLSFQHDGERLVGTESPAASVTYEHDAWGSLIGVVRDDGARVRVERGPGSRVEAIVATSPTGETARTAYEYDSDGEHVSAIVDPSGGRTTYEYDAGRLTAIGRPNGVRTEYGYAPCGRVSSIVHRNASGPIWTGTFELDSACRVRASILPEGRSEYGYDAEGRLADEVHRAAGGAVTSEAHHVYDGVGNRIRTTTERGVITRTYDRDGRVREATGPDGTTTYEYDGRGNLVAERGPSGAKTYEYDAADRLIALNDGTAARALSYDAEGNLVDFGDRKCLAVPDGVFDLSGCIAFYGGSEPMRAIVRGPDGISADVSAGAARYYHGALQDSTALVTDGAGAELGRASWDGYGVETSDTRPDDIAFGYTGEISAGGLVFLRSRWYAPHLGAFVSPDREQAELQDPRTLHRYAYVLGNPTNAVDPEGRFAIATISLTSAIQGLNRGVHNGAVFAARCFIQRQIRNFILTTMINLMFRSFLTLVENALLGPITQFMNEEAIDRILRDRVFCNRRVPRAWTRSFPGEVFFRVNVDGCGTGNRFGNNAVSGMRSSVASCSQADKRLPRGIPGNLIQSMTVSGIDFLVGARRLRNGDIEGGMPIELKRKPHDPSKPWSASRAAEDREQLVRYCRYASRSSYRLMIYIWAQQLPPKLDPTALVDYTRAAVDCAFPWRTQSNPVRHTACGVHNSFGAVLLWVGRDARSRKIRVYKPSVSGLC